MHGFSSLLLGIECKHSLLSRAASVVVFRASQAGCLWRAFASLIVKQKSKLYVLFACISLELHLFIHPRIEDLIFR